VATTAKCKTVCDVILFTQSFEAINIVRVLQGRRKKFSVNGRFPHFRCRSSVAVSPFCRCKIPLFCKNYVRKFRSVTVVNSKNIRNGNGNGHGPWATVYGNGNG